MARPHPIDRLVFSAFTYKGEGSPTLTERAKQVEQYRANNRRRPDGTYLDMSANLPVVDPEKVLAPVLLIRGEYDGIATSPT
jgi:hypothetical protein